MDLLGLLRNKFRLSSKAFGDIGEDIAKSFLISAGYKILNTKFKCKQGEIDIIAQIGKTIAFIEVKTRSSTNFGHPEESVTKMKQWRISKTARYYIHKNNESDLSYRADIVAIILKDKDPEVTHLVDAFKLIS